MIEAIADTVALRLERMAGMRQRLLDIHQAAEYLGMSEHALRHKACVEVPRTRIDGKLRFDRRDLDRYIARPPREGVENRCMAKGELGTAKPYLRGKIWWIRYTVPGEGQERFESSKSTNMNDAIRLMNKRRKEIDDRQVTSTDATVGDLLRLYLEDQKWPSRHSYKQADGYVRLHLEPTFGKIKASALTTKMIQAFIDQKQAADYANASINRRLEALRRAYTLGLKELPPLVYVAPEIEDLMLDENDNVREGFLEHEQYVRLRWPGGVVFLPWWPRGEIVIHKVTKRKRLRSIKLNQELRRAMQHQLQAFRDKFGRDLGPDPVFFDDDADAPVPIHLDSLQRQIVAIVNETGSAPELIDAYCRTGVIATHENYSLLSPEDRDAWKCAIAEYSAKRGPGV